MKTEIIIDRRLFKAAKNHLLKQIKQWIAEGKDSENHPTNIDLSMGYGQHRYKIPGMEGSHRLPQGSEGRFFGSLEKEGIVEPHPLGGWKVNFNYFK
jgi:hypothetical protein